jgi:hypothetical protein
MSEFNLDDFFPLYVKENDTDNFYNVDKDYVYNSIAAKKEFTILRPYVGEKPKGPGLPLSHQEFVANLMSPYTPYDRLLVFHGLGTGKSVVMAAVAELAKKVKAGEISNNEIIVLVRNPTLRKNIMNEIATVATNYKYYPSKEEIKEENLSEDAIRRRVSKRLGINYEIETFTTFVNSIKMLTDFEIKEKYSNRYVLIDEAHNIRVQAIKTKKQRELGEKSTSNYKELHRFLHCITGSKILLLTATPMRDSPVEICQLLNLILPLNKQLDKKGFMEKYFSNSGNAIIPTKINEFKSYIKGMISYLRSSFSNVKIKYEGSVDKMIGMKFTNTVRLEMGDFQNEIYKKAYLSEAPKEEKVSDEIIEDEEDAGDAGIWGNSRQSSMFVFPDGTYGRESINKVFEVSGIYHAKDELKSYLKQNGSDRESMLEQLKVLSIKFYYVIKQILENPKQKMFVYSNIVSGGGCLLFGAILEIFGMSHPIPPKKGDMVSIDKMEKKDRYIVLTGSTLSSAQFDFFINKIFNHPDNRYGDYVRVVIGSHIVGEGVSFKHIRKMFVMTPFWNNPTTEQAIGRAIRYKSHDDLKPEEQNVSVYRLAAEPGLEVSMEELSVNESSQVVESIDMLMYKVSEDKDIKNKQIERLLKESAIDCALNRQRNILKSDKPFSKECDYQEECNYRCDYVNDKYYNIEWVGERIQDTYNLYYARDEMNNVKSVIKEAFLYKFAYDFEELYQMIMIRINRLSPIVLVRSLNEIIMYNEPINNRYGFECYLREDRNLLFLTDDPFSPSLYTTWYYTKNPEPDESYDTFSDLILSYQYEKIEKIIELLKREQDNPEILERIFRNLSVSLTQNIVEIFLLSYLSKSEMNKNLQQYIYETYKNYIVELYGETFLTIDPTNRKKLIKYEDESLDWVNVSEEDEQKIQEQTKSKIEELKVNPWGYYGYITNKYKDAEEYKNFSISVVRDVKEKKEGGEDARYARQGLACNTGDLSKKGLVPLYYDILIKAKRLGRKPPMFEDKNLFTKDQILKNKNFESYLYSYILNTHITKVVFDKIDNMTNQEISQAERTLLELYSKFSKKDKKEYNSIINSKGNFIEINKDIVKEFYNLSTEKEVVVDAIIGNYKGIKSRLKEAQVVENEIKGLDQENLNNLGAMLSKTGPNICGVLREWFKENGLLIQK